MKLSVVTVLCGAAAASAAAIEPGLSFFDKRAMTFTMKPIEVAKANIEAAKNASRSHARPLEHEAVAVKAATQTPCSSLKIRTEWRELSAARKASFVGAIKCLVNKPASGKWSQPRNRYEDLVFVHQQMVGSIHQNPIFLMWHRYYVHVFIDVLRVECGFNDPLPWWDETKDAGHFIGAPMFDTNYFGACPARPINGGDVCMAQTGVFKGLHTHIGPGGGFSDRCLARSCDDRLTAQCNNDYVQTCRGAPGYDSFESCVEYGPHAYGHNGIGATMSDVASSPGDPIFFMHHSFVDHQWRIWQNDNRARLTDGGSISLDATLSSMGLRPSITVRDIMDTTASYLCYRYNY